MVLKYNKAMLLSSVALFATVTPGLSAASTADPVATAENDTKPLEEIVISSDPLKRNALTSTLSASALYGEALKNALAPTIGEALDRLPGISQSYFGPGAGRPLIRGQGGDRVRVLINDIGTIDVSTTSVDHSVALDLSSANRVEVIRGPSTLIYGSNAAGGVVSVFDGRIPTAIPEDGYDGEFLGMFGTNANEILTSGNTTVALSDKVAFYASGFYRDTQDISIPGFAESEALRLAEAAEGEEEGEEEEEVFGTAENSDQTNFGVTGGLSYITDRGFFGFSVSYLDNNYGLPGGHGHGEEEGEEEEGEEEEVVRIDQEQVRVDFLGELTFDNFINKMKIRASYADYQHIEFEGDEVGTTFDNEGFEGRLELNHDPVAGFSGVFGAQYRERSFSAIGEEAFVPENDQTQFGLFIVERGEFGRLALEGGSRIEFQDNSDILGRSRNFTMFSTSGGANYQLAEGLNLYGTISYTERGPNAEELFSNGPHLATRTFEIGRLGLFKEASVNYEAGFNYSSDLVQASGSIYFNDFSNYLALLFTGEIEDDLPVARFSNQEAEFFGFEGQATFKAWEKDDMQINIDTGIDYVEARITSLGADAPFIPPLSIKMGVAFTSDLLDIRFEGDWNQRQNRVFIDDIAVPDDAEVFEFPTDDFFLGNLYVTLHPFDDKDIDVYFQVRNLFDNDIRFATSVVRDFVPAPGQDVRFGLRVGF